MFCGWRLLGQFWTMCSVGWQQSHMAGCPEYLKPISMPAIAIRLGIARSIFVNLAIQTPFSMCWKSSLGKWSCLVGELLVLHRSSQGLWDLRLETQWTERLTHVSKALPVALMVSYHHRNCNQLSYVSGSFCSLKLSQNIFLQTEEQCHECLQQNPAMIYQFSGHWCPWTLTIGPKIPKFLKQGQIVREFPGKSSRKSGNCCISEKQTIQLKIPEIFWNDANLQFLLFSASSLGHDHGELDMSRKDDGDAYSKMDQYFTLESCHLSVDNC